LLQEIADGLIRASELALLAVGLTMVYGVLRFANFAHLEFATLGAYLALAVSAGLGAWLSLGPIPALAIATIVAIAATGVVGVASERLIFGRLRRADPIMLMIASFALGIIIRETIRAIWGPSGEFYEVGIFRPYRWGDLRITPTQIVVIAAAVAAMLGFHLLLSRTRLGIAMRATADNAPLAQASGVYSERIIRIVWFIGAGFAALGGVVIGLNAQIKPDLGLGLIIEVFAAAIVGGIGNPYGAMVGALLVGFAESIGVAINWAGLFDLLGIANDGYAVIPTSFKPAVPFVLLILTLLLRPQGILGARR
jgi:branched-subunit amino acid ABC-type transport system permease component